jgi:predicted dienelactone hydrolase
VVRRSAFLVACLIAATACTSAATETKTSGPGTAGPGTSGASAPSASNESPGASPATTTSAPEAVETRPFSFTVRHEDFVDPTRPTAGPGNPAYSPQRELPTDIYLPDSPTPRPLIVFSHGYHGAPRKFSQLFRAWARAGYVVAAPRFPLTSDRGAPYDAVGDFENQPGDISFVLTQLLEGELASRIDASRVGAAGLSLGGATTYGLIESPCCRDTRIKSAALLDAVRIPIGEPFEKNKIPVLIAHIDTDLAVPYKSAQEAYAESASPKWLLTFAGGIHAEAYEDTPSPHDETATQTSIDFFDLTLLGDESARARLLEHGDNAGESSIEGG